MLFRIAFTSEEIICGLPHNSGNDDRQVLDQRDQQVHARVNDLRGILPRMAVTSPSIICGIAATMARNDLRQRETSEVNSRIPALMICGSPHDKIAMP